MGVPRDENVVKTDLFESITKFDELCSELIDDSYRADYLDPDVHKGFTAELSRRIVVELKGMKDLVAFKDHETAISDKTRHDFTPQAALTMTSTAEATLMSTDGGLTGCCVVSSVRRVRMRSRMLGLVSWLLYVAVALYVFLVDVCYYHSFAEWTPSTGTIVGWALPGFRSDATQGRAPALPDICTCNRTEEACYQRWVDRDTGTACGAGSNGNFFSKVYMRPGCIDMDANEMFEGGAGNEVRVWSHIIAQPFSRECTAGAAAAAPAAAAGNTTSSDADQLMAFASGGGGACRAASRVGGSMASLASGFLPHTENQTFNVEASVSIRLPGGQLQQEFNPFTRIRVLKAYAESTA
eukprot:g5138.t1